MKKYSIRLNYNDGKLYFRAKIRKNEEEKYEDN
jgi:hypothetical protein